MDKQERFLKLLKTIGGVAFMISFALALVIFGGMGRSFIDVRTARILFIGFGGLGLILNLVTYQTGKYHPLYNLTYWSGAIVTFVGLLFFFMHWPYGRYILIGGLLVLGVSFFLPKKWVDPRGGNSDLLDDQS